MAADTPSIAPLERFFHPSAADTLRLMEAARERRILLGRGGLNGNVLRISPPINIAKSDVDQFICQLDASFAAIGGKS